MEIPGKLFTDIVTTMRHARIFITSREKMHWNGVSLYDDLLSDLEEHEERTGPPAEKKGV